MEENSIKRSNGKKRFGIAFAGGGARGFAQVGALKALEEHNVRHADIVCGTSVGSIIGAAYSLGMNSDEIYAYGRTIGYDDFSNRNLLNGGLRVLRDKELRSKIFSMSRDSNSIEDLCNGLFGGRSFEHTICPFYAVAVDLKSGEEVVFDRGNMARCCRASSSVPGVFTPTEIDDYILTDGGVLNNMPADVIRPYCDVLLGIELFRDEYEGYRGNKMFDVLINAVDIMANSAKYRNHSICDVLVEPDLQFIDSVKLKEEQIEKFYAEGYRAMTEKIGEIKMLLGEW